MYLASSERTLTEMVAHLGGRAVCIGLSKDVNAKATLLLFADHDVHPSLVAKVPATDVAAGRVAAEVQRLAFARASADSSVLDTIPRVLAVVEHRDWPVLVVNALPGQPMLTRYHRWRHISSPDAVARDFADAGGWLARFQSGPPMAITAPSTVDLGSLAEGTAGAIRHRFGADPAVGTDVRHLQRLREDLVGERVTLMVVHGDYWLGNILVDDDAVTGVVDWEEANGEGLPVHDVARFVVTYSLYLDRHTRPGRRIVGHRGLRADRWGVGIDHAVNGSGWYPDLVEAFGVQALRRLGVSASAWRHILLVELIGMAAVADNLAFAREHLLAFRRLAPTVG